MNKLLTLPRDLLKFWYPEALVVILRSVRNSLLYLEEDLAVGLMWQLLFVPLFHDVTIVGRVLSFIFRISRILLGLSAFVLLLIVASTLTLLWFSTPLLALYLSGNLGLVFKGVFFCGSVLFSYEYLSHPYKKVWQIKRIEEIWQASFVKAADLRWEKLIQADRVKQLLLYLEKTPQDLVDVIGITELTPSARTLEDKEVLKKAWEIGKKLKLDYLGPEQLFVALILSVLDIEHLLMKQGLIPSDFDEALDFLNKKNEYWRRFFVWDPQFHIKHLKGVNRGWMGIPTPTLDRYFLDLTKQASRESLSGLIGRSHALHQVIRDLSNETGSNVIILGAPGYGKSSLINTLAAMIISGDAPEALATKRLVKLDISRLLLDITSEGELANRIKTIFEEVKATGNVIIFLDEIQGLGVGEAGILYNLYSLLTPYIDSSKFQFLATTEGENYTRIIEKNSNFARLFLKVELPEASEAETLTALKEKAIENERHKKVQTSILALRLVVKLSSELIHDRVLPDSALRTYQTLLTDTQSGWILQEQVKKAVEESVKVPLLELDPSQAYQLLNLDSKIHKSFIDQKEAVSAVTSVLQRAAAKLKDKNRPIGSFLFVGPTGVGKTELAKVLNEVYFKTAGKFIRFDMSEYQTLSAIDRLLGKGGEEGILTQAVRDNPYCLILLDEFEKAESKLLNIFLQVLDDARLTSGAGRVIDFRNTIIIATSNVASELIARGIQRGEPLEKLEYQVKEELLQVFKPELVNRFDEVVIFKPLFKEHLEEVVKLKLQVLSDSLKEQGYDVDFTLDLIKEMVKKGYDPVMGARPLRRLIQDSLETKLSRMILEGKFPKGEKITLGVEVLT